MFMHKNYIFTLNTIEYTPSRKGGSSIQALTAIDARNGTLLWESYLRGFSFHHYQHMEIKNGHLELVDQNGESILEYGFELETKNKVELRK